MSKKKDLNEILFRIHKALNLTIDDMLKAYACADYEMDQEHLKSLLVRRQEKEFKICSYEEIGVFLDGLVAFKRGASKSVTNDDEAVGLTNNLILKKLRIVLELKDAQIGEIFWLGGVELTKQQLSSLFRNENHKNYKALPDELLMVFFDGLDIYLAK
jgi:uncharacterized protein YehS (DUF1456 family)